MSEFAPPAAPPLPPEGLSDDAFLLAYLESHEAPCPACGYNAHKLHEPRCPECGIHLVLNVFSSERLSKSWVTLMLAGAATAGLGALLLILVMARGFPPRRGFLDWRDLVPYYFLVMIPAPAAILWIRRRFSRLAPMVRRPIAIAVALWTLVLMVLLARC